MSIQRRSFLVALVGGAATGLAGCLESGSDESDPTVAGRALTIATTTSTDDTGLLDDLNAAFEDRYGVTVETVAQGTGAALETGRRGDADVVLVHARELEDAFLTDGDGVNRRDLMYNDFVVVGGPDDPAAVDGEEDVLEAFSAIADAEATFVSRGDESGTHAKERDLWERAGVEAGGTWYREAGSGMGEVLVQTDTAGGYTLADRGTYRSMREELELEVRVEGPIEGGPDLLANPYGIVVVNPAVHEHVEYDLAMAYVGFLTGPEGQDRIESYAVDGEQLFFPRARSTDPNFEQYVPEGWRDGDGS